METKAVFGVMLTLLLIGMLTLAFNIQPVKAEPTTIVVPDDHPTIQEAINAANEGDTIYVRAATYYEHVVVNKTVSLIGENRSNTIIDGNYTGNVMNITASNVNITGFTIQKSGTDYQNCGIYVSSSSNNLSYNIITNNLDGIRLEGSSRNNITGNNITTNNHYGIKILYLSNNNSISGNSITNNGYEVGRTRAGVGVSIYESNNNILRGNIIAENLRGLFIGGGSTKNRIIDNTITSNNYQYGVFIRDSDGNFIITNHIGSNDGEGILIRSSTNNIIRGNTISGNVENGIHCESTAYNNMIYHNDFINNINQVHSEGAVNVWDDDYPSGGNFWSDYTGVDSYSGPYQNETGSDGIGDTPYVIDENNQDKYPLMKPRGPIKKVVIVTINLKSSIVDVGDTVTFIATPSGGIPPYKVQWYRNGTEITAVKNQTIVSFAFNETGIEIVKVVVTDSEMSTAGQKSIITILPPPTTIVKILPVTNTFYTNETLPGDKFVVNATVQNVTDLWGWQMKLTWDPTLLNLSDIWLPSDHIFAESGKAMIYPEPIVEPGSVTWGCTYINIPYWTFYGTGTLFQIELEILTPPTPPPVTSNLTLVNKYIDTLLLDGTGQDIPFTVEDGIFTYMPPPTPPPPVVTATVGIHPHALNLRSGGKWVTGYIELPEGYDVSDVDVSTILLNGTVPVDSDAPTETGDYDNDGVQDLMVKFNRAEIISFILKNVDMSELFEERFMIITLTMTGVLNDGTPIKGSTTIKTIYIDIERLEEKMLKYESYMQRI